MAAQLKATSSIKVASQARVAMRARASPVVCAMPQGLKQAAAAGAASIATLALALSAHADVTVKLGSDTGE
jgi:hypothetical protein